MFNAPRSADRSIRAEGESLTGRGLAFVVAGASPALVVGLTEGPDMVRSPADVVVLLGGVAASVVGGWWMANVVAWSVALRRGSRVHRFTLPGTRQLAQLMLIASLSGSCVAEASDGPAMVLIEGSAGQEITSTTWTAPPTSTARGDEPPTFPTTAVTSSSLDSATESSAVTEPSAVSGATAEADTADQPVEPAPAEPGDSRRSVPAHQVIVARGDNLWSLSAESLERHGVAEPTNAEIAQYWRLVVAGNQVRSGDADLIVPGETIDLPAHEFAI